MRQLFITIFILFILSGCSIKHNNKQIDNENDFNKNMQSLSLLIESLSQKIDKNEAKSLAYEAINHSKKLANEYEIVAPALFHNSLVNMGIKQKGYCYHYANDLKAYLHSKKFKSFKLIKAVANKGEYFEHTSLVLTRDDISFENSIILDAWRDSGILYFSKVKDDKRYKWEKR